MENEDLEVLWLLSNPPGVSVLATMSGERMYRDLKALGKASGAFAPACSDLQRFPWGATLGCEYGHLEAGTRVSVSSLAAEPYGSLGFFLFDCALCGDHIVHLSTFSRI